MKRLPRVPRRQTSGFMLIEMLAAIMLLTAFALVASRVFSWSMRVIREAPEAQQQIQSFDAMTETLRRDAWGAAAIDRLEPGTLILRMPGAPNIRWRIDGESVTRTTEGDDQVRAWPELGGRVRFDGGGAAVVLTVLDRDGKVGDIVLLPSELLMIGGAE